MFRDNAQLLTSEIHNFVLNHGALGDVICSLPAIIRNRVDLPVPLPPMTPTIAPLGTWKDRSSNRTWSPKALPKACTSITLSPSRGPGGI